MNRSDYNAHAGLKAGVRVSCATHPHLSRNGRFWAVPLIKIAAVLCVAAIVYGAL